MENDKTNNIYQADIEEIYGVKVDGIYNSKGVNSGRSASGDRGAEAEAGPGVASGYAEAAGVKAEVAGAEAEAKVAGADVDAGDTAVVSAEAEVDAGDAGYAEAEAEVAGYAEVAGAETEAEPGAASGYAEVAGAEVDACDAVVAGAEAEAEGATVVSAEAEVDAGDAGDAVVTSAEAEAEGAEADADAGDAAVASTEAEACDAAAAIAATEPGTAESAANTDMGGAFASEADGAFASETDGRGAGANNIDAIKPGSAHAKYQTGPFKPYRQFPPPEDRRTYPFNDPFNSENGADWNVDGGRQQTYRPRMRIRTRDEEFTRAIVWCAALTALLTAFTMITALRALGLLSFSGSVVFRGNSHAPASVRKLQQVWDSLSGDFYEPVDEDRMIEFAAAGMAGSLGDIYTTYYTKDEMRVFTEHSAGVYHGIGVYVAPNEAGNLVISGFLEGSPAREAGVQAGDVIVSVDGADVIGITDSSKVIEMIKGLAGTSVTIGFYRRSTDTKLDISIERREIKTDNIFSRILYIDKGDIVGQAAVDIYAEKPDLPANAQPQPGADTDGETGPPASGTMPEAGFPPAGAAPDSGLPPSGTAPDAGLAPLNSGAPVGYIYLTMFDGSASEYFNRHLNKLLEANIKALIIDLRGNPGGDYEETVKIADRLLGEGTIVYTEDRAGRREYRKSDANKLDLPIFVLINGESASASEILAGAIKDNGAGKLIGTKTFGKGLVQAVLTLDDGAGLKYTRSRYYTPSGTCIQGLGIEPDIYAPPGPNEADADGEGSYGYNNQNPDIRDIDAPLAVAVSEIQKLFDAATQIQNVNMQ